MTRKEQPQPKYGILQSPARVLTTASFGGLHGAGSLEDKKDCDSDSIFIIMHLLSYYYVPDTVLSSLQAYLV